MAQYLRFSFVFSLIYALACFSSGNTLAKDFDIRRGMSQTKLATILAQFSKYELAALNHHHSFSLTHLRDALRKTPIALLDCNKSIRNAERAIRKTSKRRGTASRQKILQSHWICASHAILQRKHKKALTLLRRGLKFVDPDDPISGIIHSSLAYLYTYGFGVPVSRTQTFKFLNKAKRLGDKKSELLLEDLQRYGEIGRQEEKAQ